jgi:hypothetical protein
VRRKHKHLTPDARRVTVIGPQGTEVPTEHDEKGVCR